MRDQGMFEIKTEKRVVKVHPLDEVIWNALASTQSRFAIGDDRVRRYLPSVAPFAAMVDASPASFKALRKLIEAHGPAALRTPDVLPVPPGLCVIQDVMLVQMTWQGEPGHGEAWDHVRLNDSDVPEMVSLTTAAQPGPFGPRTIELGSYLGVRRQGKLVAMAGERMRLHGYTEISAVCVDAAFRGQGHATGLIKLLISAIHARDEIPFLHVLKSNRRAIDLYQELGFVERSEICLTVVDQAADSPN
jgi:predicted GNAT family acetyltransferase